MIGPDQMPPYGALFRLHAWAENVFLNWPHDLCDPPPELIELGDILTEYVEAALAAEGMQYMEMLRAIHDGKFGGF
jgi:hypothetical protein